MNIKRIVFLLAIGMVLTGLAAGGVLAAEVKTESVSEEVVKTKEVYVKTADNFIILFDASGTFDKPYADTGMPKVDAAKKILKDEIEVLPDLGYNAGLYLYTPFKTYYEMGPFNKAEFLKAIDSLPNVRTAGTYANQPTPLGQGLDNLGDILSGLTGKTTVFVFSDGQYTMTPKVIPQDAAQSIVGRHDVCFFLISSADKPEHLKVLEDIAALNECSRVVPFEALYGRPEACTGALCTIKTVSIAETITTTRIVGLETNHILFDFDKVDIRPDFQDEMDAIGRFLQENASANVVLEGFTDSVGSDEYNLGLSRRRVESVANYLSTNYNIDPNRIILHWYGTANPVASNSTEEGRQLNRRVEVEIAGME